jgi:hypothetical protein
VGAGGVCGEGGHGCVGCGCFVVSGSGGSSGADFAFGVAEEGGGEGECGEWEQWCEMIRMGEGWSEEDRRAASRDGSAPQRARGHRRRGSRRKAGGTGCSSREERGRREGGRCGKGERGERCNGRARGGRARESGGGGGGVWVGVLGRVVVIRMHMKPRESRVGVTRCPIRRGEWWLIWAAAHSKVIRRWNTIQTHAAR